MKIKTKIKSVQNAQNSNPNSSFIWLHTYTQQTYTTPWSVLKGTKIQLEHECRRGKKRRKQGKKEENFDRKPKPKERKKKWKKEYGLEQKQNEIYSSLVSTVVCMCVQYIDAMLWIRCMQCTESCLLSICSLHSIIDKSTARCCFV